MNVDAVLADPQNVAASRTRVGLFVCPSDPVGGQVPGLADFGGNYVACNGTVVTLDATGAVTAYTKIPDGNGLFAQVPVKVAGVTDGLSNTAAFSESTLGDGHTPASAADANRRLVVLEVAGGNDPTPADCDGANGTFTATRGGQWINGHFGNTLYNQYYPPNPAGKWDSGNASHNKALSTARSYHTGGVNLLLADGGVRVVRDAVTLDTWRALSTRAGGEVPGEF